MIDESCSGKGDYYVTRSWGSRKTMSKLIDNLIIGTPIEGLTLANLGIGKEETTVTIDLEQARELQLFLPRLLVEAGLFKNTSEVKRISKDREKSTKIKDPDSRNLWRTLERPEMTHFKIGKRNFWLVVGDTTQ